MRDLHFLRDPNAAAAHQELATALIQIGQFDEAIWNLKESLRVNETNADVWTMLGGAELASGHVDDAIQSFTRALQINPNFVPAQRGLQAARSRG